MDLALPPRYREWLEYCFFRFKDATDSDDLWVLTDEDTGFQASDAEIVDLYTATAVRSGTDLKNLSNVALGFGLSIMFQGYFSDCIHQYVRAAQPDHLRAIASLFRDCIELRRLPMYHYPDPNSKCRLGSVVFDFWDNSVLNCFHDLPRRTAIIDVMEQVLKLESTACIQSALHGLGHQHVMDHKRVAAVVDAFLEARPNVHPLLVEYAYQCREGNVI